MIGFGAQPIGTTSGLGQPPGIEPLPSFMPGARYLDTTGNPVIDPVNGGFLKADDVCMRVYLALRTTLGSSGADKDLGAKWPKKMGTRFEAEIRDVVYTALGRLIRAKTISLKSVDISYPMPEYYELDIKFINLVTQKDQQVRL